VSRTTRAATGRPTPPVRRRTPWPLALPATLGALLLLVPLLGLLVRAPWGGLSRILVTPEVRDALWLSLSAATMATGVSIVLGVPLAWVLARSRARGVQLLRALVTLPLVLPPVVGGVALLLAFGRNGLVGRYLEEWFGVSLPFTTAAVVIANTFVAMPFLVVALESAFRSADRGYDEAAATLGADRLTVFWRVTLPLVRPALVAGAVLCWARALGEFGATVTFAGNLQGTTRTMPLAVYLAIQSDPEAALALSLVLLLVSVLVLFLLRGRWVSGLSAGA
jgi:molybdate transport system permease protein